MVTNVSANANTDTLLEVKNLFVDYQASTGTVHAVTDVNFTLKRGEILGLAGESGSGKSTLAYAITCLLRPPALISDGEILYYPRQSQDGRDNSRVTITHLSKSGKSKQTKDGYGQSIEGTKPIDLLQLSS
jgi:peptide/nickel transport system ATP-binding protein